MRRKVKGIYSIALLVGATAVYKFWQIAQDQERSLRFDKIVEEVGIMTPPTPSVKNPLVPIRKLMDFISHWEGFQDYPYKDSVGVWTIGYGFNLETGSATLVRFFDVTSADILNRSRVLKQDELDLLLLVETQSARDDALSLHPELALHPLEIQLIVVDMVYNLGKNGFSKFVNARGALDAGDYNTFAEEIKDSVWFGQTGRRSRHHYEVAGSLDV